MGIRPYVVAGGAEEDHEKPVMIAGLRVYIAERTERLANVKVSDPRSECYPTVVKAFNCSMRIETVVEGLYFREERRREVLSRA